MATNPFGSRATSILDQLQGMAGGVVQASPVSQEDQIRSQIIRSRLTGGPMTTIEQDGSTMTNIPGGGYARQSPVPLNRTVDTSGQVTMAPTDPTVRYTPPLPNVATRIDGPDIELKPKTPPTDNPFGLTAEEQEQAKVAAAIADKANKEEGGLNKQLDEPSFMKSVKSYFGDEGKMLRLAMAFNTMRLEPDQGLHAALSKRLDKVVDRQAGSRTAAILRAKHPQIAQMLEAGVIDAKTAITMASKNPTQIQQMIDLYKNDPNLFAQMAKMGAFGGDYMGGEDKWRDKQAESLVKRSDLIREKAGLAGDLRRQLSRFQMLLQENPDFETGPFAARLQQLRQFGASIGIDVNEKALSTGQSLNAAAFELVANELRKNKGPQTDFDAKFTSEFVPGLGNTADANEAIINYMQSANIIMGVHGDMLLEMPDSFTDARKFVDKIEQSQRNTPAAKRFDGEWITLYEYMQAAKAQDSTLTDLQILQQWRADQGDQL